LIVLSHALHDDGTTKIGLFCEFLNVLMWKIVEIFIVILVM